jgi:ribosomal protein L40E
LNNNYFLIILSILVFFFVAIPAFVFSAGLGVLFWLVAVAMFFWGWIGRSNEIKAERIRRRGELEEEGRQRAMERRGSPPAQIVKETIVTKEVVLIQCRHCGARYPQGTAKCFTCGANL